MKQHVTLSEWLRACMSRRTGALVVVAALSGCSGSPAEDEVELDRNTVRYDNDVETDLAELDAGSLPDAIEESSDSGSAVELDGDDEDAEVRSEECAEVSATPIEVFRPIDIVWAIDTSESMYEETEIVEQSLNDFVGRLLGSGLDIRVVMLADDTVCVPPPLSGGLTCPDVDGERYLHLVRQVYSRNAMELLMEYWWGYEWFLRDNALLHIIVVTDDESYQEPSYLADSLPALGHEEFVFHAIASMDGACTGPYGNAVREGVHYRDLAGLTGGTTANICDADWDPIFDAIGSNVAISAALPCEFGVPELDEAVRIDFTDVDVTRNGEPLPAIASSAFCDSEPGWYFDDPAVPTAIHVCPTLCGEGFEADDEISIIFNCVKF
ncbi:MAG: hypothetical protein ACJAYU_001746 [Bradymonadia bacterium]|jgi:hypothetical protein